MIFDMNTPSVTGTFFVNPDFPFASVPLQPTQIQEQPQLGGAGGGNIISLGATAG